MIKVEKGFFIKFDVGDESVEEEDVGNSRSKTAMEARVVAPDTSVRVNGENSGKKLREEEKEKRNIKRSPFENEFLLRNTFENPSGKDNYSNEIYKKHFVKLENFTSFRPEEKGSEEEEREVAETEELVEFICFRHWG